MTQSTLSNTAKGRIGKAQTTLTSRRSGSHNRNKKTRSDLADQAKDPIHAAFYDFAAAESEVLAWRMLHLAKYGDRSSLERIFFNRDQQRLTPVDLGELNSLDDLFDAQRRVLMHVAEGHMIPSDALRVTSMLTDLRQTLLDTDLQRQIDELKRKINDA